MRLWTHDRIINKLASRETWSAADLHETFGVSAKGCKLRACQRDIGPRYVINGMKFWTAADAFRLLPNTDGAWTSSRKQVERTR